MQIKGVDREGAPIHKKCGRPKKWYETTGTWRCKECQSAKNKEWRRVHPDANRKWCEENPEKVAASIKQTRLNLKARGYYHDYNLKRYSGPSEECKVRREARRDYALKHAYGISWKEYETLLISQNGRCAICKKSQSPDERRLSVDHDHATGKVRGLLCPNCNSGISLLDENVNLLAVAQQYLRDFNVLQSLVDLPGVKPVTRASVSGSGLTQAEYLVFLRRQGGICSICKISPNDKRFAVDHDHVTGKIRGLLCDKCNRGIGRLLDDPHVICFAEVYLRHHQSLVVESSYAPPTVDIPTAPDGHIQAG